MSLLQRQAAAFRQQHLIPEKATHRRRVPPSLLFSPEEAKLHDAEEVAALALHGIKGASQLDPDLASFAVLFEGPPPDRDLLTAAENTRLNGEIKKLLMLLSPHLLAQCAQECLEGLLQRYEVHRYNVDHVIACALPYHDSPIFTRLVQGLHIEGISRWAWLRSIKEKPATLVRSTLAKYCAKENSVLTFLGEVVQDTAGLQKGNRALLIFFTAVWLDTLASVQVAGPDLVLVALPPVMAALRQPHLRDGFQAAVAIAGALCAKVELDVSLKTKLCERVAKAAAGDMASTSIAFLVLILQLQGSPGLSIRAVRHLADAGAEVVANSLPEALDSSNFVAALAQICLTQAASIAASSGKIRSEKELQDLVQGLLKYPAIVDRYAGPLCAAVLQAFKLACLEGDAEAEEQQKLAAAVLREPLAVLNARQPLALSAALSKALDSGIAKDQAVERLLTELLTPAGVQAADDADGSMVDVIRAFSDSSAKKRSKAAQKAIVELESGTAVADAPRQKLLVSLLLQSAQDQDIGVARKTLKMDVLWSSLPQASALSTAPFLLRLLASLLPPSRTTGESLAATFSSLILEKARACALVPLALQCFALVYQRADCTDSLRRQIDASLLPLLVLCIVGLDLLVASESKKDADQASVDTLRCAVLQFCEVSEFSLFKKFKAGACKSLMRVATRGMDAVAVLELCKLVDGRPPEADVQDQPKAPEIDQMPNILLVGAIAEVAAVKLMADALHDVIASLGSSTCEETDGLVIRCAEACERFAKHQVFMDNGSGNGTEFLCKLTVAVFAGIVRADARHRENGRSAAAKTVQENGHRGGRRSRKGCERSGGALLSPLQQATAGLLRFALERPCSMRPILLGGWDICQNFMRLALLQLALGAESHDGPDGGAHAAATVNALNFLHTLLLDSTDDWARDQALIVPLVAKLVASEASKVRSAVLRVLEAFQGEAIATGREAACSLALQEAGILRLRAELLTPKGWSAAEEQELSLRELVESDLQTFINHVVSHKAGLMKDRLAACSVLAQYLRAKNGGVKASRLKECAFWSVGLSMLTQPLQVKVAPLLDAVPVVGSLSSLQEPLRRSVQEISECLSDGAAGIEAPVVLTVVMQQVIKLLGEGKLPDELGEKVRASAERSLRDFLQHLALPLCTAFIGYCEHAQKDLSKSMAELASLTSASISKLLGGVVSGELRTEAAVGLLKLCVASSAHASLSDEAEVSTSGSALVSAAAHAAFVGASLDVPLLCALLQSPTLKVESSDTRGRRVAMDVACKHIASFKHVPHEAGSLLMALGEAAKHEALAALEQKDGLSKDDFSTMLAAGPLEAVLLAMAALSEHMSNSGTASAAGFTASAATACDCLNAVCKTLTNLPIGIFASILRSCNALAPFAESLASPAPLQTCIEALSCFEHSLTAELVNLLKASLGRFWKYPSATDPAAGDVQANGMAQQRTRLLLQITLVRHRVLFDEVNKDLCLSLARSIGLSASLDFTVILLLVRQATTPTKRKSAVKRRSSQRNANAPEEERALVLSDGAVEDEALSMLTAVDAEHRFYCLGTLAQTLSCIALELCPKQQSKKKSPSLFWGSKLLPDGFVQDTGVGEERALWVLGVGLTVIQRFISEHGLPEELDDAEVDLVSALATADGADAAELNVARAAVALCYVAKATCVIEALLEGAMDKLGPPGKAAKEHAQALRQLLLRSLAVNHPRTFFRAVCFGLQISGHSPTAEKGDLLARHDFFLQQATHLLVAASEALRSRGELAEVAADAEEANEIQVACAPLCTAAMQFVCEQMLGRDAGNDKPEAVRVVVWHFLEGVCRFSAKEAPKPVLELCMPAVATCLEAALCADSRATRLQATIACCSCLQTAVEELGRSVLERLSAVLNPLLQLVSHNAEEGNAGTSSDRVDIANLESSMMQVLQSLVRTVGPFLSPFLDRILRIIAAPASTKRVKLLEGLGRELVASVPHRLLLPAVQKAVTAAVNRIGSSAESSASEVATIETNLIELQRLALLSVMLFSLATPDFVSSIMEAATDSLLRLLAASSQTVCAFLRSGGLVDEVSIKVLRRDVQQPILVAAAPEELSWSDWCSEGVVMRLTALSAAAFTQFSLRLSVDDLKPRFLKVLDWSRNLQTTALARQSTRKASVAVDAIAEADDACRVLSICAVMHRLTVQAPDISEILFLPMVLKDIVSCLTAARRYALQLAEKQRVAAKKRKRAAAAGGTALAESAAATGRPGKVLHEHTWWWLEVLYMVLAFVGQALRSAGGSASQAKIVEDAVEALVEPCADVLDVCQFLPALEDSALSRTFLEAVQAALVAVAAASDSQHVKRLLSAVLSKTRGDDSELRLCAVKACHKVWLDIGVQAVSGLSEVLMHAVELLEDEDPRVETAVRALVKTMEECTGESLQDHLKH